MGKTRVIKAKIENYSKSNAVAGVFKAIAWICFIVGLVAGIYEGRVVGTIVSVLTASSDYSFSWGIALIIFVSFFMSGMFFYAVAEIIGLLQGALTAEYRGNFYDEFDSGVIENKSIKEKYEDQPYPIDKSRVPAELSSNYEVIHKQYLLCEIDAQTFNRQVEALFGEKLKDYLRVE